MTLTIDANLPAVVFMKVGQHAGEDFDRILERKREELRQAGRIFWGYGGGTMHPIQKVQPFARLAVEHGHKLVLVMQSIDSRHPDSNLIATEYSQDGLLWQPIPEGVIVKGSKYALVLDEITPGDLQFDLSRYRVGIGPAAGKVAASYVQGRVDKACLERTVEAASPVEPVVVNVGHTAPMKEPYAVLLR